MPQWVYSASAATAALVLAVLISADATGLLTPDIPARVLESAAAAQAAPESFQGDGAVAAVEMAAPLAPVAELAAPAEKGLSVTVTQETEVAVAKAEAPALRESAIAPQAAAALEAQDDSGATAPVAAMAQAQVAEAAKAESAPPPPVPALAAAEVENVIESESTPLPTVVALTAPEKPTEPAVAAQEFSREIPPSQGTSMLWRILEGLAAIAVLAFLGSWLLRRRSTR
jgi:hypothetical protein